MKKVLSLLLIAALSATMLVACGGDDSSTPADDSTSTPDSVASEYVDGTYRAESATFNNGYKEFLVVTYKDGKVTDVDFDAYSEKDETVLKSTLTIEEYPMFTGENEDEPYQPSIWYPTLEESIKNAAAPADVELIADATHSCENAQKYLAAIQEAAKKGDTEVQVVDLKAAE